MNGSAGDETLRGTWSRLSEIEPTTFSLRVGRTDDLLFMRKTLSVACALYQRLCRHGRTHQAPIPPWVPRISHHVRHHAGAISNSSGMWLLPDWLGQGSQLDLGWLVGWAVGAGSPCTPEVDPWSRAIARLLTTTIWASPVNSGRPLSEGGVTQARRVVFAVFFGLPRWSSSRPRSSPVDVPLPRAGRYCGRDRARSSRPSRRPASPTASSP